MPTLPPLPPPTPPGIPNFLFLLYKQGGLLVYCPPTQSLLLVFLREHRQSVPHFKNYYYMLLWHQIIMNKQLQMNIYHCVFRLI